MPESDLALLIRAAREAGEIALGFARDRLDIRDKGDGAGPVTSADLAVNAHLEEVLRTARPGYGWLSEESAEDPTRREAEHVFVIDPIDGTRSFIDGSSIWAHSLSVVRAGVPVAGVVYLPERGKLYAGAESQGATLNDALIAVRDRDRLGGAEVLSVRSNLAPEHWPRGVPPVSRGYRPSLAYRLCLVAEGRYDAMFTFRPSWEWDIAAGVAILSEAGAAMSDQTGGALRFNSAGAQTDGVIVAGPKTHKALLRLKTGS